MKEVLTIILWQFFNIELFQEIHDELQDLEPVVCSLQTDGSKLIRKSQEPVAHGTEQGTNQEKGWF